MLRRAVDAWPIALVAGGIFLLLAVPRAMPQIEGATYLGSDKCKVCHQKLIQPPVYDAWAATLHAKQKAAPDDPPEVKYRYTTGFDPATGQSVEQGVACEDCHGPGSKHGTAENLTDREKAKATTVRPQQLSPEQQMSLCGACHSVGEMPTGEKYPQGFTPGKTLQDLGWKLAADPGTTRLRQYNDMMSSGTRHIENGVTCVKCHTTHGDIKAPPQLLEPINALCTQEGCHPPGYEDLKHAEAAGQTVTPDMTCGDCHMPDKHHIFVPPEHETK
jgi:predicted CXXCH cytochrome family protein